MKQLFFITIVAFLLLQCAQQSLISGGEKDSVSPALDSNKVASPPNGSVNFQGNEIVLYFDELVALNNPEKQILISPFLKTQPDIYAKGKKIILNFKEPLEANTTYIINFGDAIVDVTEGNGFRNYKYVFSTGSFIDSLAYSAFVYDAFTKQPLKDALVLLHSNLSDSAVVKEKPSYFGKTNSNGICVVNNIAEGTYNVFALKDENDNYLFDQKNEQIGFAKKSFVSASDTLRDTIALFVNRQSALELKNVSISKSGKGVAVFNRAVVADEVQFEDSIKKLFKDGEFKISSTSDSVFFWVAADVVPTKNFPFGMKNVKPFKFNTSLPSDTILFFTTNASANLRPQENLVFKFSQPISSLDSDKMSFKINDVKADFEAVIISENEIIVAADYKEDEVFSFEALPGAFVSYYGLKNDTMAAQFEVNEANKYSAIALSINVTANCESFILELLRDDKLIKRNILTLEELNEIQYNYLDNGRYSLRLVYDENKDGNWNTGDFQFRRNPERVEYYNELIDLRKGWDIDLKWIIK